MAIQDGPKRPVEEYHKEREERYWNGEMPDKIWDNGEPVSHSTFISRHGRPVFRKEKKRQDTKIWANKKKKGRAKGKIKKTEKTEMGQHLPVFFDALDNPKFRNGLMKKDRWRTYQWLARHIIRQEMKYDRLNLYDDFYTKGKLAACIPTRVLARDLKIGRQTANDHIDALKNDGVIRKVRVDRKKSWDGQNYNVCVFGTHKDGKQRWYIQDAFGVSGE